MEPDKKRSINASENLIRLMMEVSGQTYEECLTRLVENGEEELIRRSQEKADKEKLSQRTDSMIKLRMAVHGETKSQAIKKLLEAGENELIRRSQAKSPEQKQNMEPKSNPLIVFLWVSGIIVFGLLAFTKTSAEMVQGFGKYEAVYMVLCMACFYGLIKYTSKFD